jgi:hypothetical protein
MGENSPNLASLLVGCIVRCARSLFCEAYTEDWDRCYNFKNIFAKILANMLAFFAQTIASFRKILITKLVFEKNANFFLPTMGKNSENCDHNIAPWFYLLITSRSRLNEFRIRDQTGKDLKTMTSLLKQARISLAKNFGATFRCRNPSCRKPSCRTTCCGYFIL